MRPFLARFACCALIFALTGCGEDEYGILIRAYGGTPSALLEGTSVRVTVRDLKNGTRSEPVEETLQLDACTPDASGGGCAEGAPDHVRVAIDLARPGQFMVHLSAVGRDGTFAATRCYTVVGVTKSDVLLVGPVLAADDADGDGWTAAETCRERGLEEPGCKDQCPDQWGLDCDDEEASTNPGASEKCQDGVDQDCDGTDPACADNDGDTYDGCPPDPEDCCTPGPDVECPPDAPACVDTSTCDCDDTNPNVNPGILETEDPAGGLCDNAVDEDCDGVLQPCDKDGDHVLPCTAGITGNCDCDDSPERGASVYPGAPETPGGVCDGIDNNCNGLTDEVEACLSDDLDGDGSKAGDDCNDCAASMSPLEDTTICGDRIDEDCSLGGTSDGRPLPDGADGCPANDADGDGFVGQAAGGTDCDDGNADRHPGAPDRCGDAVDDDCSGQPSNCTSDADGDGYNADNDCNDDPNGGGAAIHPGAADPCDGTDNDCDGVVDEEVPEGSGCILGADGEWVVVDFAASLQHCGSCRHNCNPGCADGTLCKADGCTGGTCACSGDAACEGTNADYCCPDGCQDLTGDPVNCGRCGQVCPAPACQVPVCRNGACATVNMEDGTPCGGGNYCCNGQCTGECAPGSTSAQGCGDCGSQTRNCGADCTWGVWGACQGQGVCTVGNAETRGCGDCGDQDRICQGDCAWGTWGVCYGQGECTPGTSSAQGCGNCGTQSRTCENDCSWGGYGSCGGEGACTPGQVDSRGCGSCGTQTRRCQDDCTWGTWAACGGEGVCAPNATDSQACGNCGTQERTCTAQCQWGDWAACGGEGACRPTTTQAQACGDCGSQTRTCSASCQWNAWGACGGEGACSPNATEAQACGNCGTQGRTCSATCQWSVWGNCSGEGECAPATSQEVDCNECGSQHQICSDACVWEDSGSCDNNPGQGAGVCTDPDVCTTDTCGATGTCVHANCSGGTPNCCANGCFQCCAANDCTDPGVCRHATCSGGGNGGTCGSANDTDGTDPQTECNGNGGRDICCGGACHECCGASTTTCGAEPLCRDWTCSNSTCTAVNETNGTDPETECGGHGGRDVCCGAACVECCGTDASSCPATDPPGLCTAYVCTGNACAATGFIPNGQDPFGECPGGTNNCNGAGGCTG